MNNLDPAIEAKAKELLELAKKYNVDAEVGWHGNFWATVNFRQVTKNGYYDRMHSQISFTDTGKIRVKSFWHNGLRTESVAAKHIEESLEFLAELNDKARAKIGA